MTRLGANQPLDLWRGMANLDVADAFLAEGGTEFAPMSTTSSLEVWEIGRSPADHQQPRGRRLPSQLHLHVSCTASLFSATAPLQLDCSHTLGECIRDTPPRYPPRLPSPTPLEAGAEVCGGGARFCSSSAQTRLLTAAQT